MESQKQKKCNFYNFGDRSFLHMMSKLAVRQGYDGCSAMAGIEGGVQAIVKRKFPKAFFVLCSSHRLNLVVNDLNSLTNV